MSKVTLLTAEYAKHARENLNFRGCMCDGVSLCTCAIATNGLKDIAEGTVVCLPVSALREIVREMRAPTPANFDDNEAILKWANVIESLIGETK